MRHSRRKVHSELGRQQLCLLRGVAGGEVQVLEFLAGGALGELGLLERHSDFRLAPRQGLLQFDVIGERELPGFEFFVERGLGLPERVEFFAQADGFRGQRDRASFELLDLLDRAGEPLRVFGDFDRELEFARHENVTAGLRARL